MLEVKDFLTLHFTFPFIPDTILITCLLRRRTKEGGRFGGHPRAPGKGLRPLHPFFMSGCQLLALRKAYQTFARKARYETLRQFSTEPIDKTEDGDYTAIKQQLRRFLDEVLLQQHPFYLGLAHSS